MARPVRLALLTANLAILLLVSGAFVSNAATKKGYATYYSFPYRPNACYGNRRIIQGAMFGGASQVFWNKGRACGTKYDVKCLGGLDGEPNPCKGHHAVRVTIVDYCPNHNCKGTIELTQQAFSVIADLSAGAIRVSYKKVA